MTSQDKEYYCVIFVGHNSGIYTSWEATKVEVHGYSGDMKKRYNTLDEAGGALLHEDRYRLTQTQLARTQQQTSETSDGASTSASALKVQHQTSETLIRFVVIFS